MNYKDLGDTGIQLPEIGLGTSGYQGGTRPLREGISLGAVLIDTGEAYGTEEIVSKAIKDIRDQVFIATKVSSRHFRYPDLLQAADRSLKRLQTDRIDLYQLHSPSDAVPLEETMGAMEDLVDSGKVRFIGVSNFGLRDLQEAQAAMRKHRIVSNQVRYNLVDRTIELETLRFCQKNGITIIAYSPLARGMHNLKRNDTKNILGQVAAMTGKTEAQVALNWCVSRESVITIPKSDSSDHVIENCRASGWRLTSDQVRLLEKGIRFRRRGRVEVALRRTARRFLQRLGYRP